MSINACEQWRDALIERALGGPEAPGLAAHLSTCAACAGTLEAGRARAAELDRGLKRLAGPEPHAGGPERVMARIRRSHRAPRYGRLALATLALAACGVVLLRPSPSRRIAPATIAKLSAWSSPTASLLRSSADPLLKTVPRLGGRLFEMNFKEEDHAQ